MKVKLTPRRIVEADSEWFRVGVTDTAVTVRTDFGAVRVRRTSKGLEVTLQPNDTKETVVETYSGSEEPGYVRDDFMATLHPIGLFTLADMDKRPNIQEMVQAWMKFRAAQKPKPPEA